MVLTIGRPMRIKKIVYCQLLLIGWGTILPITFPVIEFAWKHQYTQLSI